MAGFQVLQRSRVLICFDSRGAQNSPRWLQRRGFSLQDGMFMPAAPEGSGYGYVVFAKLVNEGAKASKQ